MSKIVKNTTLSAMTISDVGVTIPASDQYVIPASDYLLWAGSNDIVGYIGSGDAVVNDGSFDLSISDGIDLIKGLYPKDYKATTSKITNLSLTANTEASHTFSNNVMSITIRNRNKVETKIAFAATESGTKYITLNGGCVMSESELDFSGKLIYVQSPSDSTLEILELYF